MIYEKGDIVKLKSLTQVVREEGVSDWTKIRRPILNSKGLMNHLFGNKVRITEFSKMRNVWSFSARDINDDVSQAWNWRKSWIDENDYKLKLLPDELFEI